MHPPVPGSQNELDAGVSLASRGGWVLNLPPHEQAQPGIRNFRYPPFIASPPQAVQALEDGQGESFVDGTRAARNQQKATSTSGRTDRGM
ncbi:hypothetical protein ACRE_008710 [Hapsidospora chrysogenum ATCC 11550]|uniref:Uncharacterized protein n=1 Tax=Hapsidospora chrysogenum (strain ATCC 11550 / CBS 779.69 / DSM 880 / IAM 14645 / JCM 23072 / IMI 49137) TaxID=857340 RepID=A0A086TFU0_HAPC1|nr:hypothetical protein ACRE_008710 [Hapsidospora chrysogenum ATCC 11550]